MFRFEAKRNERSEVKKQIKNKRNKYLKRNERITASFIFTLKRKEKYRSKTKKTNTEAKKSEKKKYGSEKENLQSEKKRKDLCNFLLRSETKNWK